MPREFREKRESARVAVDCEMSYKVPGDERAVAGRMKNLSGRGMMFLAPEEVPLETRLEVFVNPEGEVAVPLHALVRVVRVARQRRGDAFEIGAVIKQVMES